MLCDSVVVTVLVKDVVCEEVMVEVGDVVRVVVTVELGEVETVVVGVVREHCANDPSRKESIIFDRVATELH